MQVEILKDRWLYNPQSETTKQSESRYDSKRADRNIKHCTICDIAWEKDRMAKTFQYYEDFVTYGKEKKICPSCKGEETISCL